MDSGVVETRSKAAAKRRACEGEDEPSGARFVGVRHVVTNQRGEEVLTYKRRALVKLKDPSLKS